MKQPKKKPSFVYYLALWGCVATGLIYTAVGIFAILSFMKLKDGGADESSLLVFLDRYTIGKVFIWIILLGMAGYIIWRVYETIRDPYGYGKTRKGILRRTATALSGFADVMIGYSAIMALTGKGSNEASGQPKAEQEFVTGLLEERWGQGLVVSIGILIVITAIIQLGYVLSKTYKERMDIDYLEPWKKTTIHSLAWIGHIARGVIIGIIGYHLIKAGIVNKAQFVVNTDKAFDFIGDEVGAVYFICIAAGTICYGLFMFAFGWYYDVNKD